MHRLYVEIISERSDALEKSLESILEQVKTRQVPKKPTRGINFAHYWSHSEDDRKFNAGLLAVPNKGGDIADESAESVRMAISKDKDDGGIVIEFEKLTKWIKLPTVFAVRFAMQILGKTKEP